MTFQTLIGSECISMVGIGVYRILVCMHDVKVSLLNTSLGNLLLFTSSDIVDDPWHLTVLSAILFRVVSGCICTDTTVFLLTSCPIVHSIKHPVISQWFPLHFVLCIQRTDGLLSFQWDLQFNPQGIIWFVNGTCHLSIFSLHLDVCRS